MKPIFIFTAVLAGTIGVPAVTGANETGAARAANATAGTLRVEGTMPSLYGATEWLNSPPLTPERLRGKVVLVDFWTYTCINWRRTLPSLRSWAQKYKDQGLVVIGVHTPEFAFERDSGNVRRAVTEMGIRYPVAVDTDANLWRAFHNQYWPAIYVVDARGQIRHRQFGEGGEAQTERAIQGLLVEAGNSRIARSLVSAHGRGIEAGADWASLQSPENYLGYERTKHFSSASDGGFDEPRAYRAPAQLNLNHWATDGVWTITKHAVILQQPEGRISYGFHARDLHLVMGPSIPRKPIRFRVLIDGRPPGAAHGEDVDAAGNGTVTEHRLYQLVRQTGPIADRHFEIQFLDSGVEAYAFTFG
jgi:thiol-disulfide isomerase/thioredoxin